MKKEETDIELLELAAKAAGFEWTQAPPQKRGLWVTAPEFRPWWNPLEDDGDALRLAVSLKLEFYVGDDEGRAASYVSYFKHAAQRQSSAVEHHDNHANAYAATRRAIVRAAAELQRAKEAAAHAQ